ncbi:MAG: RluA family pseudouridine synthase [Deltaproteobacteria bacterium]|nr:MAG: RluA family pseudouridine synthase [Deltaproteobacteria bacterium]
MLGVLHACRWGARRVLRAHSGGIMLTEERFVVEANHDGWRLDRFLTERIRRATRSHVQRMIAGGARFGDGRPARPGSRVRAGDEVFLTRRDLGASRRPAQEPRVVAEDGELVVLEKPGGWLVHRNAHELSNTIEAWLSETWPGERVEPVHRLDRDTSGLLLCARGVEGVRRWRGAMSGDGVRKEYLALVEDPEASWRPGEGRTIDVPLGFDASSAVRLRMGVGDLACATEVEVIERRGPRALLGCVLRGGRQHQIRAHLYLAGTPVVGDKLYGMGDAFFLSWLEAPGDPSLEVQLALRHHALHAHRLTLEDGRTWCCGPPDAWCDRA